MKRRGLTMVEMMMTLMILAIVSAVALPMFASQAGGKIAAASLLLRDDLEQARFRTVANPSDPRAFQLDADGQGWSLIDPTLPGVPVTRDDGSVWHVRLGEGRAVGLAGVEIQLDGIEGLFLAFDEAGAVSDRSAQPSVRLSCEEREQTLTVGVVTGIVRVSTAQ